MQTMPPIESAVTKYGSAAVQPSRRNASDVINSVATVIPEIGFDDEPTSPVRRDDTEFHYGVGVKYAFTGNWAVRGEWEKTDKLKVELLSIGVEYRF